MERAETKIWERMSRGLKRREVGEILAVRVEPGRPTGISDVLLSRGDPPGMGWIELKSEVWYVRPEQALFLRSIGRTCGAATVLAEWRGELYCVPWWAIALDTSFNLELSVGRWKVGQEDWGEIVDLALSCHRPKPGWTLPEAWSSPEGSPREK